MGIQQELDGCCSAGTAGFRKELDNLKTLSMLKPCGRISLKDCIKHPFTYELVKATLIMIKIILFKFNLEY